MEEGKNRMLNIQQQKISEDNVYQFLLCCDKLYNRFTDLALNFTEKIKNEKF